MKTNSKIKTEKRPPKAKAVKDNRRVASRTNGKHPLTVYQHLPIGIVEASLNGNYMDVNEEICRILGYSRQELLRRDIKDCTYEEDYAIDAKLYEQLIAGIIPFYRIEKRFVRKNGEHIWVELTRSLVSDAKGKPLYTVGVVLDISDRKDVERVLRDSVERLRLATGAAQMFMWEWDFQTESYAIADNFEKVLGFSAGLLPKNKFETVWALSPKEDVDRISQSFERAIENRSDLHAAPCRVVNPENGQTVWLEISAKIVYDREGKPERMYGVAQNITENKRMEDALRDSEERFRAMISQATAGIAESNIEGRLVFVNPGFCQMLGYSDTELLGKTIWELTCTEDLEENKRLFRRMIEQEEPYQFEKRFICKDGAILWTSVSVTAIHDLAGKPKGGVGVILNIEKRKQAEDSLAKYARQQEALHWFSNQLHRTESLAGVYHVSLDAILSALQCDRASILLFDETSVMHFVAWRGLSDAYRKAIDGHSPWTQDTKEPQPIAMEDVRTADLTDSLREVIQEEGIGSLAFIPLVSSGKLIGKFMVYFNTPHTFEEAELDLSLSIARQLASAIDRKRAEEALRRERETLERLFETMPVMVSMIDPVSNSMRLNAEFERQIGWKSEEVTVLSLLEALYPDAEYRQSILQRMAEAGKNEWVEVQVQTRDGRTLDSVWSNISIVENQRLIMGIAIGIDITERKQTDKRLALLAEISEMLRNVDDPYELMYDISKAVGEHLNVKRALFNEIDLEHDREIIHRDYHKGLNSVAGIHKVSEYSSITSAEVAAGRTVVNHDSKTDPRTAQDYERTYAVSGERAYVAVPLMRDNRWVASFWVSDDAPRQWADGEISLLETVAERTWTIIEKLRIDTALRESERRFREMINALPAAIYTTDAEGTLTHFNPAAVEFSGRTPDLGSEKWCVTWKLYYPDGTPMPREECPMALTLKEGRIIRGVEAIAERPDGSRIWFEPYPTPLLDSEGKVVGGINMLVDITERKRAEEALRRNEQMFSTLVDAAPFGVYFIDSEFRLRSINKGAEAVFSGIDPLIGRDFAEILRIVWQEPFATEAIERFRHTLRTGESFISPPMVEPRANIDEIEAYDWQIHRITLSDGTFGVVCYFYDLSEQKKMEATVRASEALYRMIARNIPGGGVYVVDKDFRYLIAEGPVTEAFGLSREMLEGRTVTEAFPGERGERMEGRLRQTFAGETVSFETEHQGRIYWTQQAPLAHSIGQAIILTLDITERKRAEEALRHSEKRFAHFMQHLPGLAWIKDTDGRYVYANAAAEKAFNTPREKLYGSTDEDIFRPEMAAQFRRNDELALSDEKGVQVIETLEHADGVVHSSLVSKFPIPGPDGSTTLIGGTAFDITERLRAEEALLESEQRFRAILQQATAGIVRKDPEGRLVFVNEAFCNMLGYTELDLIGKTVWEFMHPDDEEENRRSYERLIQEGIPFKLERRFLRRDGSMIWVDASVSPIMDARGKPQSAVAVEVDITRRKLAEDALRELNLQLEERVLSRTAKLRAVNQTLREEITERQRVEEALRKSEALARANEEKLSTLFELLPVGISFLDPQGRVIQANPALTHIMHLSKEQLSNQAQQSRKYIRANGTLMSTTELASQRALLEGKTVYNVETGLVLADSEVVWTSVSAAPVNVAEVGAVEVTVDITESKRAERALQESRERLQILSQRLVEVQEEERRAIARELHDRVGQTLAALNINLIIISGQLGVQVGEQIRSRLNDSMKLVAETIALVRDVMSNLRPSVLDDYGLASAIDSHLAQFTSRYGISIRFEKPDQPIPRLGPSVEMTFLRIAQEALMNVAKHAQADQVTLSLQREENAIYMRVQDNGSGITSWQEANRPGSHGLTIMRERAEAFGGHLNVSSTPGKGTKVEVKIPVETDGQSQAEEEKSE